MARKKVVEVRCDRCERVEYKDPAQDKPATLKLELRSAQAKSPDREVSFEDLCSPCYQTVIKLVDQIAKDFKGKSPKREAKAKGDNSKADAAPEIEVDVTLPD